MYISRDILISSSVSNKGYVFLFQEKYTPGNVTCIYIHIYIYVQYVCTFLIIIKIGVFEKQYCIYGSNIEYTFT